MASNTTHTTTTHTTTTSTNNGNTYAADGTAGGAAAQGLGDKIKGGWNGTGEGIRGNVNSFIDNVGEQIAGRGDSTTHTTPASRTEGGERPSHVAARGADEIQQGMAELKK
ncbi:hypothetical protein CI109_100731 [Kwoniella shandongensis]|uniref:Uncharacterized protein n=1 Tax=Kwoniella shandongensis TaxID=1734106 RepID=A0AAJ8LF85_9TREE